MGSLSFLDRGRGAPTFQTAAPPGADMGNSAQINAPVLLSDPVTDAYVSLQGRASLSLLAGLIVMAVVFYMWTRSSQGS